MKLPILVTTLLITAATAMGENELEIYRGLIVVAEKDVGCDVEYSDIKGEYSYDRHKILRLIGQTQGNRFYRPYTNQCASSLKRMDVEHIIAMEEAHDSGLCKADNATRKAFAESMINLTVADCYLNRCNHGQKCAKDVAEWQPAENKCWFAERTLEVRREWGLTIDPTERDAVKAILDECESTDAIQMSTMCSPLSGSLNTAGSKECKASEGG